MRLSQGSEDGSVMLVSVLFIILILSLLTLSLSRRTGIDVSLAENGLAKQKARYVAWAGWVYSLNLLKADASDEASGKFDTLYQCGIKLNEDQTTKDFFEHVSVGEDFFGVDLESGRDMASGNRMLGFMDEERKINLNALDSRNYTVLSELLIILGIDQDRAERIAANVVDWIDEDKKAMNQVGDVPEDSFYSSSAKSCRCKNRPFDHVDELLLINGITPELFSKFQGFVTVFPKEATQLSVNINTAPIEVLEALGRSLTRATNTHVDDAESLAGKIGEYRRGDATLQGSKDVSTPDFNEMKLNAKEKALYLSMAPLMTQVSNIFRIKVKGVEASSGVESAIEGVVTRKDYSVLSWKRN